MFKKHFFYEKIIKIEFEHFGMVLKFQSLNFMWFLVEMIQFKTILGFQKTLPSSLVELITFCNNSSDKIIIAAYMPHNAGRL